MWLLRCEPLPHPLPHWCSSDSSLACLCRREGEEGGGRGGREGKEKTWERISSGFLRSRLAIPISPLARPRPSTTAECQDNEESYILIISNL